MIGLAKLLQRSIRGDFPSDEEWNAAAEPAGAAEKIHNIVACSMSLGNAHSSFGLNTLAIHPL